jgi:hypothetical protein
VLTEVQTDVTKNMKNDSDCAELPRIKVSLTIKSAKQTLAPNSQLKAMPWLRWSVTGISPKRPRFMPRPIHVRFAVDKVAMGQVLLRVH